MTKARARYTLEFKQEAVRRVEGGQSIAAAARTLGVVEQTLFNWVKAQRAGKLTGADGKAVSAEQMEISRLRTELARVKRERDILGKATAAPAACAEPKEGREVRPYSTASATVADLGAVPGAGG
jgi:transposase